MIAAPCPVCGCKVESAAHAVAAAVANDEIDRAFDLGLLDCEPCPTCSSACRDHLQAVRCERLAALAARERHRARDARLQRRATERAERRAIPDTATTGQQPSLPPAAAAALARAKAKAAKH